MIGKNRGKLIQCRKCKSEKLEVEDRYIEQLDDITVSICYDVWCKDCNHNFEISDIFKYDNSK